MSPHRALRNLAGFIAVAWCLSPLAAHADGDAPCAGPLRDKLKIANTAPDVCETTTRLVPGRAVVLALWSTTPDSPPDIPLAVVLDRKSLEAGRKDFLYKRKAQGESIEPFLFDGKTVNAAIADFDGSGRIGWAMWVVPDTDYSFDITVYDPRTRKFVEPGDGTNRMTFVADDLDAKVQVSQGQILVPVCDSAGGTPLHPVSNLYFDVYRLRNGNYEKSDRIQAGSATAAERAKCRQTGQ
ncbi:MAG: hypothetical protein ABSC92_17055 [Rhizomicrobium sp.]|jgi:hypothetical protein